MRIGILLTALAALASAAGSAGAEVFPVVVKAYESELPSLRLPGSNSGTLGFKACAGCEYRTVRVTASTIYEADGRRYGLQDFRAALAAIGDGRKSAVTIKHHLESDTITSVRVTTH